MANTLGGDEADPPQRLCHAKRSTSNKAAWPVVIAASAATIVQSAASDATLLIFF
jgi:hypothetical protein